MRASIPQPAAQSRTTPWLWLGPMLYMAIVALYFIGRYGGQWAEADSATFAQIIRQFTEEGRLIPQNEPRYPNGYTFQAISAFILAFTGVDVATLQQLIYPLVVPMVVLPAWIAYRELTGSARGATITTILLFTQPEFLFVILRSSHEKFTRSLLLLCFFFLLRSFKLQQQPRLFAVNVVLFYLITAAFIASNNLLAHSFIFAISIAMGLGWIGERRSAVLRPADRSIFQSLEYAIMISLGLVYIFTFYVYWPAQHDLLVLQDMWQQITALFLDTTGDEVNNSYAAFRQGWRSPYVYLLVSIANWIVLAASFLIWSRQGVRWIWRGVAPNTLGERLLWLFYAAFAAQGALAVVSDATGTAGGNLQHRLFPSFAIVAVAVVGAALNQWQPRRFARSIQGALAASVFCVAILSVFKATNEPLLSNKWTFYRASELAALNWTDAHLKDAEIWTENDERLVVTLETVQGGSANSNEFQGYGVRPTTRNMLLTTVTRLRSSRFPSRSVPSENPPLRDPLPVPPDAMRVYDNGEAQLYHLRPETPFQK